MYNDEEEEKKKSARWKTLNGLQNFNEATSTTSMHNPETLISHRRKFQDASASNEENSEVYTYTSKRSGGHTKSTKIEEHNNTIQASGYWIKITIATAKLNST